MPTRKSKNILVGKYCIIPQGGSYCQGHIKAEAYAGTYMVQLFSFLDGRPTSSKLVSVADMRDWEFFSRSEEWRYALEMRARNERRREAAE
jgi:hypothetical protein